MNSRSHITKPTIANGAAPAEKAPADNHQETFEKAPSDDEFVWGAEAIGRTINRTPTQVYYLHAIGAIPTKNVGHKLLVAQRGLLRRSLLGNQD